MEQDKGEESGILPLLDDVTSNSTPPAAVEIPKSLLLPRNLDVALALTADAAALPD
jgi:hypothetical protein